MIMNPVMVLQSGTSPRRIWGTDASPAVEGESRSVGHGCQRRGGVGHGIRGRPGWIGPVQSGAFARLPVDRLALPPGGGEEESDARLAFGVSMVNYVAEGQVSRLDEHAHFLACFADPSLDHRFARLQMARGRAELTVGVACSRPFE